MDTPLDPSAQPWFFCGIGGSGMLPLAQIVHGLGGTVAGSDRSRDQGRTAEKFAWLESHGFTMFPQDGTGVIWNIPCPGSYCEPTDWTEQGLLVNVIDGRNRDVWIAPVEGELAAKPLLADAFAERDKRIVEVHPEVSFAELAAAVLPHSKRTSEGLAERRQLLASAGIEVPEAPAVPEADLLDAAVAAWTARRYHRGEARPLPERHEDRIGAIWR